MAAEDDIKRIVIEVDGGNVSQREVSPKDLEQESLAAAEKQRYEKRLSDIAKGMDAGTNPEPILPSFTQEIADSIAKIADEFGTLFDAVEAGWLGSEEVKVKQPDFLPFASVPPNTLPFAEEPSPSPTLPFASTPDPILPFANQPSSGGGTPSTPLPSPTPPGNPPTPPAPSPSPIPPGNPPVPPPPGTPPVPPGPPPVPAGGAAIAGVFEFLGPVGLALIVLDAAVQTLGEILDAAHQIDEHIMSLAADIRPYSGEVQVADMYAQLQNMQAMIERAQEIGPQVATYQLERAELNASITRIVTKLESEFLPLAITAIDAINFMVGFFANNEVALNAIITLLVGPGGKAIIAAAKLYAKQVEKENRDKMTELFKQVDDLLGGAGLNVGGLFGP